jgi:hypothetical protein
VFRVPPGAAPHNLKVAAHNARMKFLAFQDRDSVCTR